MSEGFSNKPEEVQDAIISGDAEALSAMGKKGAAHREQNRGFAEDAKERTTQEIYVSELERLHRMYPDGVDEEGNVFPEGWYENEASAVADAIVKMREKQADLLRKKR